MLVTNITSVFTCTSILKEGFWGAAVHFGKTLLCLLSRPDKCCLNLCSPVLCFCGVALTLCLQGLLLYESVFTCYVVQLWLCVCLQGLLWYAGCTCARDSSCQVEQAPLNSLSLPLITNWQICIISVLFAQSSACHKISLCLTYSQDDARCQKNISKNLNQHNPNHLHNQHNITDYLIFYV